MERMLPNIAAQVNEAYRATYDRLHNPSASDEDW